MGWEVLLSRFWPRLMSPWSVGKLTRAETNQILLGWMCVAISDANFNISKHTLRFFFQRLQTQSSTFFFVFFSEILAIQWLGVSRASLKSYGYHWVSMFPMKWGAELRISQPPCPVGRLISHPGRLLSLPAVGDRWESAPGAARGVAIPVVPMAQPWFFREKIQRADVNRWDMIWYD